MKPIREEYQEQAAEWREKLIELAVEMDDDAMEGYLEVGALTVSVSRQ